MLTVDESISDDVLRKAYGCFPSGVAATCAIVDGVPVGMVVSSFTSVSLDPPLVSVCIGNQSRTWRRLRTARRTGLSILGAGHERACRQLAAKDGDRFAGLAVRTLRNGAIFLEGASAWLDCEPHAEFPAGDHRIVLLRLRGLQTYSATAPLVFHQSTFRQLDSWARLTAPR